LVILKQNSKNPIIKNKGLRPPTQMGTHMNVTKCICCKKRLIVVQPNIEIILGIKPKLDNVKCDKCESKTETAK